MLRTDSNHHSSTNRPCYEYDRFSWQCNRATAPAPSFVDPCASSRLWAAALEQMARCPGLLLRRRRTPLAASYLLLPRPPALLSNRQLPVARRQWGGGDAERKRSASAREKSAELSSKHGGKSSGITSRGEGQRRGKAAGELLAEEEAASTRERRERSLSRAAISSGRDASEMLASRACESALKSNGEGGGSGSIFTFFRCLRPARRPRLRTRLTFNFGWGLGSLRLR